ncbi:MAG: hypothetical protein ACJ0QY_03830 [Porticoccaceae bacterium]
MDHQEKAEQQDVREVLVKQSKLIDNNFKIIVCLIFASILIPIALLLLNCCLTLEQNYGQWFARTGSIIVLFSIIAEFLIFSNYEHMKPLSEKEKGLTWGGLEAWQKLALKYYEKNRNWGYMVLLPALIGTIIWGYGDLIWGFFSRIP